MKVFESDCVVKIRFHRGEGRSANALSPGTFLSLNCSWKHFTSAIDPATLRECDDAI